MEAVSERIEIMPYLDMVTLTASDVHRRWKEHVDIDDLVSEACVWWYGPGQKYLPTYLTEDENHVRLRRSIWRWCARFAERQKASAAGYEPVDQVSYPPQEIVLLLPAALNPDTVPSNGGQREDDGPRAKHDPSEGNDLLASVVDIRRALETLAEDDVQFLYLVEDLHYDWDRVVDQGGLEILPDSARRRHDRIVDRMARFLNGNTYYEETAA